MVARFDSQAGKAVDIAPAEMIGKPINNVLGPALARRYVRLSHQATELNHLVSEVARTEEDGKPKVVQSEHIPLPDRSVLTVEQDITDVVMERERRMRTQRQLVKTLVDVVDKRDPFAAQHSARVAKVARAVAHEMGLTEVDVETAEIAGNLLNLGKILIPQEVLAKTGDLTEQERHMIKNSIQTSANRLMEVQQEISFAKNQAKIGRVYKTLFDRKEGKYYIGRTEADSPEVDNEVLVPAKGNYVRLGDFAEVRITGAEEFDLYGEILNS